MSCENTLIGDKVSDWTNNLLQSVVLKQMFVNMATGHLLRYKQFSGNREHLDATRQPLVMKKEYKKNAIVGAQSAYYTKNLT